MTHDLASWLATLPLDADMLAALVQRVDDALDVAFADGVHAGQDTQE